MPTKPTDPAITPEEAATYLAELGVEAADMARQFSFPNVAELFLQAADAARARLAD